MAKRKPSPAPETPIDETGESLHQVRDILFGAQMRTVDRRLAQLEERLQRDLQGLRKDLEKRADGLDSQIHKESSTRDERIKDERAKRTAELKDLRNELKTSFKNLDKSLGSLENITTRADTDLRDEILKLTQSMSKEIQSLSERLSGDLDEAVLELRSEKTDITSLVQLFSDMAGRLSEDLEPSVED
jgi:DNA anti-recombination protein RmuC